MQERIARARNLFYLGLFVMLGTAMASATDGSGSASQLLVALTLGGAATAMLARIRLALLQRTIRQRSPRMGIWATQ